MPQVAAWVATAIITATGATGATAAAITIGANLLVSAGITAATTALMTPQTRAAEGRPTEWVGDPDAPYPFISGRRGTAGLIRARAVSGPNNRYQHIVTVYSAGGPISAFGDFLLDSSVKTFTGDLMDGTPVNRLWRQTKLGAQPDTVLTTPTVSPSPTWTGWTSAHKLSGKACSMITLRQDGDFKYWPSGEPKTIQVANGMLLWDPRLDGTWPGGVGACRLATPSTWVYSTNPIIHALKWALGIKHNGVMVGGIGASVDGIDVTSFIAAANICDTNSWTVSAVAYSDAPGGDDKMAVLETYLRAGGCIPASKQGKISLVSRGANPSSVQTITAVDIAGPFSYVPGSERNRRINTAIPRCIQEAHDWEIVDLAPVVGSTYVTEDGSATRSSGVTYAYVSTANQAAQLAAYDIADSREWEPFTIPLKPYMRNLEPGNAFVIDDAANLGITSQKFMVLARTYDPETDRVEVRVTTETAAKHAFALGKTGTAPASPTLSGTDPGTVPTPSVADWSLAAGTGETPSVVLTGAVPSSVTVGKVIVEYRVDGTTPWLAWTEAGPEATEVEITGLLAATAYEVAVTYRGTFGNPGTRLELGPATTGSNFATEVSPTTELVSGTGATALRIKNGRLWVGEGGIETAVASLDANGLLQRIDNPTINVGGLTYLNSTGFTSAAMQQIASEFRTAAPATRVVQALATHAASSGAIASWLTATLMAASDVQLDVSFGLFGASANLSDFPTSLTVTMYEQYSTNGGSTWSTLTAVTGGSKTLTRITSGTPTASEYLVTSSSYQAYSGSDFSTVTYYRAESPAALTLTVSAAAKTEAIYRWGLVGPTGAHWLHAASTITATDTDDKASFLVGDIAIGASTPWANPVGHTSQLVIASTGTATLDVDASAITISTQTGSVRTVQEVNLSLNCAGTGAGGLDAGTLANSTHYAVYLISNGTDAGDALLASTSFTSPTLPTGYSYFGRIGAFFTNGSAQIRDFVKKGARFRYKHTATNPLITLKSGSHGSVATPTWIGTAYIDAAPSTAVDVTLTAYTTGNTVMIAPNNAYGSESDGTNPPYVLIKTGGPTESHTFDLPSEDGNLWSASNNAGFLLRCAGYIDSV